MEELIHFCNTNSGFISNFITLFMVIITLVSLRETKKAVKASEKQAENSLRPILIVSMESVDQHKPHLLIIKVKNIGNAPAQLVDIKIVGHQYEPVISNNPLSVNKEIEKEISFKYENLLEPNKDISINIDENNNPERIHFLNNNSETVIETTYSSILHDHEYLNICNKFNDTTRSYEKKIR